MTIKKRLDLLAKDNFMAKQKLMGLMKLDLIRVRELKKDKEINIDEHGHMYNYCEFIHAKKTNPDDTYQNISKDILNKELIHEEVWMLGLQCTLDLFVKEV